LRNIRVTSAVLWVSEKWGVPNEREEGKAPQVVHPHHDERNDLPNSENKQWDRKTKKNMASPQLAILVREFQLFWQVKHVAWGPHPKSSYNENEKFRCKGKKNKKEIITLLEPKRLSFGRLSGAATREDSKYERENLPASKEGIMASVRQEKFDLSKSL